MIMETDDKTGDKLVYISTPHKPTAISKNAEFLTRENNLNIHLYSHKGPIPNAHSAKVLIVLGATGSGKTTLLNTLVTYCLGVKREDNFRYTIVDERKDLRFSVTSEVTRYVIVPDSSRYANPIFVFDTPGFGDTSGVD